MTNIDYLMMGRCIQIFIDHVNLLSMYHPNGVTDSIHRYVVNNFMHWEILMTAFKYLIEQRPGKLNYLANKLFSWANQD